MLLTIEWIKIRTRPAFWAGAVLFTLFVLAQCWGVLTVARGATTAAAFTLPESWSWLVYLCKVVGVFFVPVTIILFTAREFSLNTARQHVVDGLPRAQVFAAKALLLLGVAALYWALSVVVALGVGLVSTVPTEQSGTLVRLQDLRLLGAYYLALLGYGSVGLLLAFALRSAGAAIPTLLLYVVAIEGIGGTLLSLRDDSLPIVRRLPVHVFDALTNPARYDPAVFAAVKARFAADHVPFPELSSTPLLYATATTYIALLCAAAYRIFARRDL